MASTRESHEQVLRKRALAVARVPEQLRPREVYAEFALVRLGREIIGLPAEHLLEIVSAPPITRLPGSPAWLPGIVQVRGELMSVVDLISLYGLQGRLEPAYLAMIGDQRGCVGLLADDILGYQAVLRNELASHLADLGSSDLPIMGVTRDLVLLLDARRLLEDGRLIVE